MVKAPPTSAFVMAQPNLLLEFEIIALDPPAQLGQVDQALERDVGRQGGQPIVRGLGLAVRLLDQQPLLRGGFAASGRLRRRAHPPPRKPRGEYCVAALPPGDGLPGVIWQVLRQRLDLSRPRALLAGPAPRSLAALGTPAPALPQAARPRGWRTPRPRTVTPRR
jgi:hypothetical protein